MCKWLRENVLLDDIVNMELSNNNIKDILRDVNHFLTETLYNETLSTSALEIKEELIKKLSAFPEIAAPYLNMTCSSKNSKESSDYVPLNVSECRVESQLYEEFPEQALCYPPEENQHEFIIEYLILPASKLRHAAKKFGPLYRKEKFMGLFVERSIRCWVGILGEILYIYGSDKDPKPASFVNVQGFEARRAANFYPKDIKKRECCFELVCPGKKSLQFVASSVKDMEQWILCVNEISGHINKENDSVINKRRLPTPPTNHHSPQEYDDISALKCEANKTVESNKDMIYHNLKTINIKDDSLDTKSSQFCPEVSPEHELVYDDICGIHSSLYYNVNERERQPERTDVCDGQSRKCSVSAYNDDEDIYDDIGILSVATESLVLTNLVDNESLKHASHVSKNIDLTCTTNSHAFNQIGRKNSVHCLDNLYEPVDNPRDE